MEVAVIIAASAPARAERPPREDLRHAQVSAATANAIAALREDVLRAPIARDLTVADFLDRTDRHADLDKVLARARMIGGPRWIDDDGTTQVRLEISGPLVRQALLRIAAAHPKKSPIPAEALAVELTKWDQVRFGAPDGVRLADVPPLVFSEVMRDVDLFVGVTSIGADPTWADTGDQRARDSWHNYAFGELGATATTRREVLATLLPKLKIAPACTLEGRFLRVEGRLRTYKIHLGSGNILMEPNDQYLCIVPDRRPAARGERDLKLPFEGDQTLAVIISKAILLAADDRITDDTIVRQIRRQ